MRSCTHKFNIGVLTIQRCTLMENAAVPPGEQRFVPPPPPTDACSRGAHTRASFPGLILLLFLIRPAISYPHNAHSMGCAAARSLVSIRRRAQPGIDAPPLLGKSICAASPQALYLMSPCHPAGARARHGSTAASSSSSPWATSTPGCKFGAAMDAGEVSRCRR
jgi:hypothetical protein